MRHLYQFKESAAPLPAPWSAVQEVEMWWCCVSRVAQNVSQILAAIPCPYSLVVGVEVATSGTDVVATGGAAAAGWTAGTGTGAVIELLPGSAAEEESVVFPVKEKVAAAVGGFRASVVVVVGACVDDADTTVGCLEGPGRAAAGADVPAGLGAVAAVAGGFFVVLVIVLDRKCYVIELKDGDNFDTKKSSGEVEHLKIYKEALAAKLTFGWLAEIRVCCFNQDDPKRIVAGFKGRISLKEAMTGRELWRLFGFYYLAMQAERRGSRL
jgi:hypothetical protein